VNEAAHVVVLARELEELIPEFMANRKKDLHAMRVLLGNDDFEGLRLLGDRIKGVSGSYGLTRMAAIAKTIEDSAKAGKRAALHVLVDQYEAYLDKVQVTFE
jgi:HPt (histidine-containing phosphotransfer) domain-containing protein